MAFIPPFNEGNLQSVCQIYKNRKYQNKFNKINMLNTIEGSQKFEFRT
tara:strand:- start:369 stop:512 length:144 start_codon:yes stop_codon:yes gene_type:complete